MFQAGVENFLNPFQFRVPKFLQVFEALVHGPLKIVQAAIDGDREGYVQQSVPDYRQADYKIQLLVGHAALPTP
jgi:hypothetical protein